MDRLYFLLIIAIGCMTIAPVSAQDRRERRNLQAPPHATPKTEFYESRTDGLRRPYGICATDDTDEPRPLIVHLQPGLSETVDDADRAFRQIAKVIDIAHAHQHGCIAIRPTGRGPGSVFQNYGEVDVLEAIEDVCSKYAVDHSRVTLFGHSMGGAGVFYMASHYPDRFAGAVPMAGYCDYRLWKKPGGFTFFMPPWEEPSWQARSAALLSDNFQHTPMWMMHGEWDRGVGAGVSVEHSRQMHARLQALGYQSRITEVRGKGHGFVDDNLLESAVLWMLDQTKPDHPRHVRLTTGSLRHNTSYWVRIDQLVNYGDLASIDAKIPDAGGLQVSSKNVRSFSIGPIEGIDRSHVMIEQQAFEDIDLAQAQSFLWSDDSGTWERRAEPFTGQKRHGCSGPISDLFFENVILVPGSAGSAAENYFTLMAANNTRSLFRRTNGGLHRGGIPGENSVTLPGALDTELTEKQSGENNLVLFGTPKTNQVLQRFEDRLPLKFHDDSITLGDRTWRGKQVAVFAVFPHPDHDERYVAVHGGVTEDATTFGSHLNVLLLPDYIVYDGPQVLDWGFFDNHWNPVSRTGSIPQE